MPDAITQHERRLIAQHIDRHGVRVIPAGVGTPADAPAVWGRSVKDVVALRRRTDRICAAAADMTVPQLAERFDCSREAIYRARRMRGVLAVGMVDKR